MDSPEVTLNGPEWLAWRNHSQTRLFLQWLRQSVAQHQEMWSQRAFEATDAHAWMKYNAAALGRVDLLRQLIDEIEGIRPHEERSGLGVDGHSGAGEAASA
jgi:hypothetical protein